ncbi:uncharacterized protein B0I36DRAFT_113135 [Microdochium trichocladiopsis]|uniref:Uncharacterized protein n=1 Tax=Microdochium trichocladiopsis TaxID=1682393 RepID=A0A9P9BQB8_9PEZI|nr:uncharacterized protein B0I36DRAFT_113135 [Microdochium trichocladiopsis]KAH7030710.1 hypothetical protein B0I36DRAFT_113135 [Microdochium trichocladiopsis]
MTKENPFRKYVYPVSHGSAMTLESPHYRCVVMRHALGVPKCWISFLRDGKDRGSDGSRGGSGGNLGADGRSLTGGSLLGAVAGDVTSLAALVAGLASSVQRTAVGSSAVAGDVAELAASIALHGLSLAVARKVVGTTALVAGGGTRAAAETATAAVATEGTAGSGTAAAHVDSGRVLARPGQVAGLTAVVAATVGGAGAGQAEGRAVSLDVAETLAVIALLGIGGAGQRALVGLVA